MRVLRRALQALLGLFCLLVIGAATLIGSVYLSLPRTNGTLVVGPGPDYGLSAPVTITRDDHGIPTIAAATEDDAYFALGYVHAQDRLFEMELMRRTGQGTLSALIGRAGLPIDRFMRTLGLYRRAEADLAGLDPAVTRALVAYAAGVNAWLSHRDQPLPLEFQLLWFKPAPWRPADSLVWQKLMGLQLAGNWDEELLHVAVADKIGAARADALWPASWPDDPITGQDAPPSQTGRNELDIAPATGLAGLWADRLLHEMLKAVVPTLASNAWVVAGSRTASGKPILANDPHLGFQIPSIWYLASIRTPELNLTGATVPGVPFHVLGHNGHVAWEITTTHSDTQDLFVEQTDGDGYETPDGTRPFVTHAETIAVRFGTPETLTVRETRHGPVISDILSAGRIPAGVTAGGRIVALSAALLAPDDRTAAAIYTIAHAADAAAFKDALKDFDAPQQNVLFADTDGHIGFVAAGRLPLRRNGDGMAPVPGWSGAFDWTGWVPFEQLPQSFDPTAGFIVNSNNRVAGPDSAVLVAARWPDAYRARRIIGEITSHAAPLTVADMITLQQDVVSLPARTLLPRLVAAAHPRNGDERTLLSALSAWDGTEARDRVEPLVFSLWLERLQHALLADKLGPLSPSFASPDADFLRRVLADDATDHWCDDTSTAAVETCDDAIQRAWTEAIDWIAAHQGGRVTAAQWGTFHQATFRHPLFRNIPGLDSLGARIIPAAGGNFTVNRGTFLPSGAVQPFADIHGPGFRAVYDLANLDGSRFDMAGGESGQLGSDHYDDLLLPWRDGQYSALPAASSRQTLILRP